MRETQFISQNEDNWREFEEELKKKEKDPDKLSRLFTEITDDLSYSRSFYSNRSVRYYLNSLAQRLFLNVYKTRKKKRNVLPTFWAEELPAIIYHSRWDFLISVVLFCLSVAIGVFCAAEDPDFVRQILGDEYVEMTLENIKNGDPMGVYKTQNEFDMSLQITLNNLFVAFRTFVLGVLLSIGTIASLLYNGVMLGCFQYFLIDEGVVKESLLTVWQHGTLEISAIIIAGAAGIVLGRGWFFPGTYSRVQAFKYSAIRGMKIFIGIVPIFIMAGFIEGFITRHTEFPDIVRIMVIVLSLIIILGYYVLVPFLTDREIKQRYAFDGFNDTPDTFEFQHRKILSVGESFTSAFQIFRKVSTKIILPIVLISITYGIITFVLGANLDLDYNELSNQTNSDSIFIVGLFLEGIRNLTQSLIGFFNYTERPVLFVFNLLTFGTVIYITILQIRSYFNQHLKLSLENSTPSGLEYAFSILTFGIFSMVFFIGNGFSVLIGLILLPFILASIPIFSMQRKNPFSAIINSVTYVKEIPSQIIGLYLSILLFGGFAYLLISSPIAYGVMEFFNWNLPFEYEVKLRLFKAGVIISSVFGLCLTFAFFITSFHVIYFTLIEIKTADELKNKIQLLGTKTKLKGLAREN